jgi:serine protease Do
LAAGSRNKFEIYRDGKRQTIDVRVGERPSNLGQLATGSAPESESSEGDDGPLGVSVRPLDDETRESLRLDRGERGLVVTAVDRDSPLYEAGIREGMALLDINNKKLDSVETLEQVLEEARDDGKERVLIAVQTERGTNFVTVDVSEVE